jgi:hypothetical protein
VKNTSEIRQKLLKKVGEGFSKPETVKYLVETFKISKQAVYYHFNTKDKWIGNYGSENREDLKFTVLTRFNHIYREASFQYQHCQEHNARIGYLRTMLATLAKLADWGLIEDSVLLENETEPQIWLTTWRNDLAKGVIDAMTPKQKEKYKEVACFIRDLTEQVKSENNSMPNRYHLSERVDELIKISRESELEKSLENYEENVSKVVDRYNDREVKP